MEPKSIIILGKKCRVVAEYPATLEGLTEALKQPQPSIMVTQGGQIIFAEPV